MKLISLNTWGARAGLDNLLDFFKKHRDADIFCLQEIWDGGEERIAGVNFKGVDCKQVEPRLLRKIQDVLPDHVVYFRPHYFDFYGLALFVKKDLNIIEEGELFVYKERGYYSSDAVGNHARNIQYVKVAIPRGIRVIVNFHGLWNGQGKDDSADRLLQSDNILRFLAALPHPVILCGDFNLLPETESIKKLESFGLRNLIKVNNIASTRTSFYKKEHRFADYTFVSKDISVVDFKVLPDEVSDHNAMQLSFE